MKKYLYLVLGILGAGLAIYSLFMGWDGFKPKLGALPPVENLGSEHWQGLVAGGSAAVGLVLLFLRNKLAMAAGGLTALMALLAYLMPASERYEPMKGVWFAIGGGVLIILAGLLAPKK